MITLIPGLFDLSFAENTGAAFSMATGQTGLLTLVSIVATIAFTWFWYRLPAAEIWSRASVALVLAGAVGNLIDRAMRGHVVDFLHAFWRNHHFPVFNVADSCICVGAAILIWRGFKGRI